MKLTKLRLRQIIKEELERSELDEYDEPLEVSTEEEPEDEPYMGESADITETINSALDTLKELLERFEMGNADVEMGIQQEAVSSLQDAVDSLEDVVETLEGAPGIGT